MLLGDRAFENGSHRLHIRRMMGILLSSIIDYTWYVDKMCKFYFKAHVFLCIGWRRLVSACKCQLYGMDNAHQVASCKAAVNLWLKVGMRQ